VHLLHHDGDATAVEAGPHNVEAREGQAKGVALVVVSKRTKYEVKIVEDNKLSTV
jgi:hypothetical protein